MACAWLVRDCAGEALSPARSAGTIGLDLRCPFGLGGAFPGSSAIRTLGDDQTPFSAKRGHAKLLPSIHFSARDDLEVALALFAISRQYVAIPQSSVPVISRLAFRSRPDGLA
jgi:hypothetical protein